MYILFIFFYDTFKMNNNWNASEDREAFEKSIKVHKVSFNRAVVENYEEPVENETREQRDLRVARIMNMLRACGILPRDSPSTDSVRSRSPLRAENKRNPDEANLSEVSYANPAEFVN